MHYEEFRDEWEEALRRVGIFSPHDRPRETIEPATMDRRYDASVGLFVGEAPAPFTAWLRLRWTWNALLSARTGTCEEDLLVQLFGGRERAAEATDRPWLRVDFEFSAAPAVDEPLRLPGVRDRRAWVYETNRTIDPLLPIPPKMSPEGFPIVEGWLGEPQVEVAITPSGQLRLSRAVLRGWQMIHPPRRWEDPTRHPDPPIQEQLDPFAARLRDSLAAWKRCLKGLVVPPEIDGEGRSLH